MPNMGMIMPVLGAKTSSNRSRGKSLADALFTKTQQRVLRVLFGQPERSVYASELIREAGTGSGAAQRELAKLEESGLIVGRRIGHQKHYQANAASPLFSELRSIVLKTVGLADPIRAAIHPPGNPATPVRQMWSISVGESRQNPARMAGCKAGSQARRGAFWN